MGYRLNRLDEPVFIAVSKPLLSEFGIHYRLESCGLCLSFDTWGLLRQYVKAATEESGGEVNCL